MLDVNIVQESLYVILGLKVMCERAAGDVSLSTTSEATTKSVEVTSKAGKQRIFTNHSHCPRPIEASIARMFHLKRLEREPVTP